MSNLENPILCKICGESKFEIKGDFYVCKVCGCSYHAKDVLDFQEMIAELMQSGKNVEIKTLRRLLTEEMAKPIHDYTAIKSICLDLLTIDQDDFEAKFSLSFIRRGSNPNDYIDMLAHFSKLRISEVEKKFVYPYLINHCTSRFFDATSAFLKAQSADAKTLAKLKKAVDINLAKEQNDYAFLNRDVFICHSSADFERILPLIEALESKGLKCWHSQRNLRPDSNDYWGDIQRAMSKCIVFAVFTSKNSMSSPDVAREMELANELNKRKRIEYLLADKKEREHDAKFDKFFAGINWIDATSADQPTALIERARARKEEETGISYKDFPELERAKQDIKTGNTNEARETLNQFIDHHDNAYKSYAYVLRLLIDLQMTDENELLSFADRTRPLEDEPSFKSAYQYADLDYKKLLDKYAKAQKDNIAREEARKKAAKKRKIMRGVILPITLVSVLAGAGLGATFGYFLPRSHFEKGLAAEESGDLVTAAKEYEEAGHYGDAHTKLVLVGAKENLNSGNYEAAIDAVVSVNGVVNLDYDTGRGPSMPSNTIRRKMAGNRVPNGVSVEGATFKEWTVAKYFFSGTTLNLSLKANYIFTRYSIHYSLDGGSISTDAPHSYTMDDDEFVIPEPIKKGYTFVGWSGTGISGLRKVVTISPGTTGDKSYEAHFEANEYEIHYDYGYNDLTEDQSVVFDGSYAIKNPTRVGYTFEGWFDQDGVPASSGVYTKDGDTNLIAKWNTIEYTIEYDLNGGEYHGQMVESYNIETPAFAIFTPEREGYNFVGWTGTLWENPTKTIVISESAQNLYLLANWSIITSTLTLNPNGGQCATTSFTLDYGDPYTLPIPSRLGYTFDGWYYNDTRKIDGTWTYVQDTTFVAKWTPIVYTINLDLDGGTLGVYPKTYTVEDEVNIACPTKPHYHSLGYKDLTTNSIVGQTIKLPKGTTGDQSFKVIWEIDSYEIKLDANGGSVSTTSMTIDYGSQYTLPTPTRSGFEFAGWYEGDKKVPNSGTYEDENGHTYTAKWVLPTSSYAAGTQGSQISMDGVLDIELLYVASSTLYNSSTKVLTIPEYYSSRAIRGIRIHGNGDAMTLGVAVSSQLSEVYIQLCDVNISAPQGKCGIDLNACPSSTEVVIQCVGNNVVRSGAGARAAICSDSAKLSIYGSQESTLLAGGGNGANGINLVGAHGIYAAALLISDMSLIANGGAGVNSGANSAAGAAGGAGISVVGTIKIVNSMVNATGGNGGAGCAGVSISGTKSAPTPGGIGGAGGEGGIGMTANDIHLIAANLTLRGGNGGAGANGGRGGNINASGSPRAGKGGDGGAGGNGATALKTPDLYFDADTVGSLTSGNGGNGGTGHQGGDGTNEAFTVRDSGGHGGAGGAGGTSRGFAIITNLHSENGVLSSHTYFTGYAGNSGKGGAGGKGGASYWDSGTQTYPGNGGNGGRGGDVYLIDQSISGSTYFAIADNHPVIGAGGAGGQGGSRVNTGLGDGSSCSGGKGGDSGAVYRGTTVVHASNTGTKGATGKELAAGGTGGSSYTY